MPLLRLKPDFYTTFKTIPNYPDYEINHYGSVRSFKSGSPYYLKLSNANGYMQVGLSYTYKDENGVLKSGKKSEKTHRLVALTHIPNPNPTKYSIVDHIKREKYNNHISNLRWTNVSGNSANTGLRVSCSNKYVGVHKDRKWWRATVFTDGEKVYDKSFEREMDAVLARDKFIIDKHLEFHTLNVLKRP